MEAISINELPFEILLEILGFFSLTDIARLPMTCKHWHQLMSQDHFWSSLARKTYGPFVGQMPTKRELEELSKYCDQEFKFINWYHFRSLLGPMQSTTHVGFYVENLDDIFDYKAFIEPGKDSFMYEKGIPLHGAYYYNPPSPPLVVAFEWDCTIKILFTCEDGSKEVFEKPIIEVEGTNDRIQFRKGSKRFLCRLKMIKLLRCPYFPDQNGYRGWSTLNNPLDVLLKTEHKALAERFSFAQPYRLTFFRAQIGLNWAALKKMYWAESPFILAPTFIDKDDAWNGFTRLFYPNSKVHEYTKLIEKEYHTGIIESQMKFYLAEIVCGIQFLHSHSLFLKDCIPIMKSDGHLQFMYAGPRNLCSYSYFGLAPEQNPKSPQPKQASIKTDYYALGVFMLEVATGCVISKNSNDVVKVSVPLRLPIELRNILFLLLSDDPKLRPKSLTEITKQEYFKGIDWNKIKRQKWTPKYTPDLSK